MADNLTWRNCVSVRYVRFHECSGAGASCREITQCIPTLEKLLPGFAASP